MKAAAPLILLFSGIVIAENLKLSHDINPGKFEAKKVTQEVLPDIVWKHLKEALLSEGALLSDGYIQADVTEYAIKIVEHLQPLIIKKGMEPLLLSDQKIKLIPTGTCILTDGTISNLSTISISNPVIARYNQNKDILDLTLPLYFKALAIDYKYRIKIVLLSIKGGIEAKIKNVKLNLHMGFNFSSYHAFVDKADIKSSGSISIKFTGQGIVDWVIDLLTDTLTTLFHGIILNVINMVINIPVGSMVSSINKIIDNILERNSELIY
ncbi:unnamed protein product [Ceutorhynchus assimilis]|uniref:Uncharacterized protein n=1 Tax=Ceutorhynchus assimilis TaxID=467358 RepID=A0A9N9QR82_9CUCU|nr:unnamed protein product [Ceutorhynchus assimilis]